MNTTKNIDMTPFIKHRLLFMFRGLFFVIVGLLVAVLCLVNQEPRIMTHSSWLPVIAFVLLVAGILEAIDSVVAKNTPLALVYANLAIVDVVVGGVMLFEIHTDIERLVLLGVAYLFMKGLFRITSSIQAKAFKSQRIIATGLVSIILGFILWFVIPKDLLLVYMPAFIAIDIFTRGCSLMILAYWLSKLYKEQQAKTTS